jgi:predicted XRE-type DNA-binding protein
MIDIHSKQGRALVVHLHAMGFQVHRIASLFDVNQGRVSEIMRPFNQQQKDSKNETD